VKFTRLGQQAGLVQALSQSLGLAAGQARVRRGVEYGRHVVIHAAVLPLSSMADPFDEVTWCSPRHLFHAFMVAGMHAPWSAGRLGAGGRSGRRASGLRRGRARAVHDHGAFSVILTEKAP